MTLLQKNNLFEGVDLGNTLKKASQSMSETVSNLTTQLVNPFKSVNESVQSGVALISEGESQIMGNISSWKSSAIDGINTGLKNITGGLFNIGDLGSIVTYQDGFKVNTDELLRIGSKGLGFNVYSMQNLKDEIGNGFINELNKMTGGLSSGLFYADGKKLRISDDWEYQMGTSIIDFIAKDNELLGSVVNVAGMNAILNAMVNETVRTGMYDGYSTYGDQYIFQSDYHAALIDSIGIALGKGDVESVKVILDIIDKEGANKVRAQYPELIEQLLTNFRLGQDDLPEDYPRIRAALLDVCVRIDGPGWYQYPTQLGPATNMALVNFISEDSKLILGEEETLIPMLAGSGIFAEQSSIDTFLVDFPKAVRFEH